MWSATVELTNYKHGRTIRYRVESFVVAVKGEEADVGHDFLVGLVAVVVVQIEGTHTDVEVVGRDELLLRLQERIGLAQMEGDHHIFVRVVGRDEAVVMQVASARLGAVVQGDLEVPRWSYDFSTRDVFFG